MAAAPEAEKLNATRQYVLVLRLVVETSGEVRYGEVVDAQVGTGHRFVGLAGLPGAVNEWLHEAKGRPSSALELGSRPNGTEHGPVG